MLTSAAIKARAAELGFDACGIASAAAYPELEFIRQWVARECHGEMHYMARTAEARLDVRNVLPSARSVVALACVYHVAQPYSTEMTHPETARIASYAWGDDYHEVLQERLEALVEWMRGTASDPIELRAYVDTGPVQERVYAQYAGLGWMGKNTCLINPEMGSWLFLSVILASVMLDPDPPGLDQCGSCTLCIEACPTGAIVEPWVLDARQCLSYLTIEMKGSIPEAQRADLGSHVFGCDICQEVCPWNSAPARSAAPQWQPRPAFDRPRLLDLWRRSDQELRESIKGSALRRAGVTRLRRNLAVAIANSRSVEGRAALGAEHVSGDPSRSDPVVVEHMAWACQVLDAARPRD